MLFENILLQCSHGIIIRSGITCRHDSPNFSLQALCIFSAEHLGLFWCMVLGKIWRQQMTKLIQLVYSDTSQGLLESLS